jgi:hypothetical protein
VRPINTSRSVKFSAGFSAGLFSFRCILVQGRAGNENAKPRYVSTFPDSLTFWACPDSQSSIPRDSVTTSSAQQLRYDVPAFVGF